MRKYALNLADDKRILSATYEEYASEGMPIVDAIPEDDITDYLYVYGEYVYDPLPKPEQPEAEPDVWDEMAAAIAEGVNEV